MTEDQITLHNNIIRVCGNLMVILDIGLFPGKHSVGISECKGFVESIINDSKKALEPQVVPPPSA